MKKVLSFIASSIILLFGACSSEDNDNISQGAATSNKIYASDLVLATEKGNGTDISTRGLNSEDGLFTNEYPYDYIYIHSADDKKNTEGHKYLKIPLQDVVFCNDCQGIHLEMEVLDESEGGGYIIRNKDGEEIRLAEGESVYFSTIESSYWNANSAATSPISDSPVYIQDNTVNKELLKSAYTYTKQDLIDLLSEEQPDIPMERHCTAFRTYFMFTELDLYAGNIPSEGIWNQLLGGEQYSPDHYFIKLYLGPNFTGEYNVFDDEVSNPTEKGFYVTNEGKYVPFTLSSYTTESGNSGSKIYQGYGYLTEYGNFLMAPLNTHLPASEFSVYAFIKYAEDPENLPEDFYTSDEGAIWFQFKVPDMTLQTNRVHYVIIQVDVNSLKNAPLYGDKAAETTRALNILRQMEAPNFIVKDIVE